MNWLDGGCASGRCDEKIGAVARNVGGTLRPEDFNPSKPEVDFSPEEAVTAVFVGSELIDKTSH